MRKDQEIMENYKKYKDSHKITENLKNISENISKRIEMLSVINEELKNLSDELYYYNLVDYLGDIKTNSLDLKSCLSILWELDKAKLRFEQDNEKEYLKVCEKIKNKIFIVGYRVGRIGISSKGRDEDLIRLFKILPDFIKNKLLRYYFDERKRNLDRIIKECSDNLERSYRLLIYGEIAKFNNVFDIESNDFQDQFRSYICDIFSGVFKKKNQEAVGRILTSIFKDGDSVTVEDNLFIQAYKKYNSEGHSKFLKSSKYIEL